MKLVSRKPAEAGPNRLQPLAKLPVFFDLVGKRAVLAGGSAGAAWKAELLAAAGARVDVYASDPSAEMHALLERGAAAGKLTLHERPWSIDIFVGSVVAVGDVEDEAEAKAFRCAAKAAGVPVNTVDKPETCDFLFGSIVNRSPIVIGISTDGAAPILGQAVRRRIETLLPPALAEWAAKARAIRATVMERLRPGGERRAFWEAFADRAFGPSPDMTTDQGLATLIEAAAGSPGAESGRVTLVGAGPGDPELLTLKAVRALQSADVILFDDLVSDGVLELARREAKRMLVGKRGARESCSQSDINNLILALARQGKHVVRLKSGDPMVFGRAGEEIEQLRAAGIPVAIVPGITAAQGLAASLGVSLTHRDHAQSVTLVTGHSSAGDMPETVQWSRLADKNATTILYMAGRTAGRISERLIAEGLSPDTAVVAITSISRPDSSLWSGKLERLAEGVASLPLGAPILIGVGSVFSKAGFTTEVRAMAECPMQLAGAPFSNGGMRQLLSSGTFA